MDQQDKREAKGRGRQHGQGGQMIRRPITAQERAELMKNKPRWSCSQCVFCICNPRLWMRTLLSGFPVAGQCTNHPDTPGQVRPVPGQVCRNFRAKTTRTESPTPPNGKIAYIPLTRNLQAIVDAEDYEWLNQYKWHARVSADGMIYAKRQVRGHGVYMHRLIMQPPQGMVVDHINGNSLDNRRCNLRIVPPEVNSQNRRKRAGARSRFVGVYPRGDKWEAYVRHKYVGRFDDEVTAAKARDRAALKIYGEHAWLNFPPGSEAGNGEEPAGGSE
jgi:hypothetical protein